MADPHNSEGKNTTIVIVPSLLDTFTATTRIYEALEKAGNIVKNIGRTGIIPVNPYLGMMDPAPGWTHENIIATKDGRWIRIATPEIHVLRHLTDSRQYENHAQSNEIDTTALVSLRDYFYEAFEANRSLTRASNSSLLTAAKHAIGVFLGPQESPINSRDPIPGLPLGQEPKSQITGLPVSMATQNVADGEMPAGSKALFIKGKLPKSGESRKGNRQENGFLFSSPSAYVRLTFGDKGNDPIEPTGQEEWAKRNPSSAAKLRSIVDRQARANNYTTEKVYHGTASEEESKKGYPYGPGDLNYTGTKAKDWDELDINQRGAAYVTDDKDVAEQFAWLKTRYKNIKARYIELYVKKGNYFDSSNPDHMNAIKQSVTPEELKKSNLFWDDFFKKNPDGAVMDKSKSKAPARWAALLKGDIAGWQVMEDPKVIARLKSLGFDGYRSRELSPDEDNEIDFVSIAVFKPSSVKSADLVTFDKEGNIIDPKARFDESKPSILYSSPTPAMDDLFGGLEAQITGPRAKAKANALAQAKAAPEKGREILAKKVAKLEGLTDIDLFATAAVKSLDAQPAKGDGVGDGQVDIFNTRLHGGIPASRSRGTGTVGANQDLFDWSGRPSKNTGKQDGGSTAPDVQGSEAGAGGSGNGSTGSSADLGGGRPGSGRPGGGNESVSPDSENGGKRKLTERQRPPLNSPDRNFTIGRNTVLAEGGTITRLRNNLAGIELLRTIEKENRNATVEEKAVLAKYVGWGGIPQVFDEEKVIAISRGEIEQRRKTADGYRRNYPGRYTEEILQQETRANDLEKWRDKYGSHYDQLKKILTPDEWESARESVINAHYTSPTVITGMWDAVKRMGFDGGNVMEPAGGVGHFFGLMPPSMVGRSRLFGVELDSVSGRIFAKLYPEAEIEVTGFQDTTLPDNSQDLVISNVPFANITVSDSYLDSQDGAPKFNLHNYFFEKALRMTRPGGLVAFITTANTMDSQITQRKWLAERADFLGAIRLPNDAFKANANTQVVTDIIFLRKPDGSPNPMAAEQWTSTQSVKLETGGSIEVNEYFARHPEMILGELSDDGSMYGGKKEMTVHSTGDLADQLRAAVELLPANVVGEGQAAEIERLSTENRGAKNGAFILENGTIRIKGGSEEIPLKEHSKIRAFMKLRDTLNDLYAMESDPDATDAQIAAQRARLNSDYYGFQVIHKNLHDPKNKKALATDPDFYRTLGLEVPVGEKQFLRKQEYRKADVFTKRVLKPQVAPDSAENIDDALVQSFRWKGKLDSRYIGKLLGITLDEAETRLLANENAYRDPSTGKIEHATNYLSGNVRKKLRDAEFAVKRDSSMQRNVDALRAAMPEDVSWSDISFKMGSAWIPAEIYERFLLEKVFGGRNLASVIYNKGVGDLITDSFVVNPLQNVYPSSINDQWGTRKRSATEIAEAVLNQRDPRVTKQVEGKPVYDPDATDMARAAASRMADAFQEWTSANPDVQEQLHRIYNEGFNSHVLPTYDGSFMQLPWVATDFDLYPDKKHVVWRALQQGSLLVAHGVGGGKTIIGTAIAMEARRLGLSKKPLIVVHNATLEQFATTITQMAPTARVLVARKEDLEGPHRKEFMGRVRSGDWDAVVMAHSTFDLIPDDPVWERKQITDLIKELEDAIREQGGDPAQTDLKKIKDPTVKELVKMRTRLRERMSKLQDRRTDDVLTFQELGIDTMIVDEVHRYKKQPFVTRQSNIAGIDTGFSKRGSAMQLRAKWVQAINGGRGLFTMTGTPVTNTLGESWNMVRLVRPDLLKEFGVQTFDRFVSVFGNIKQSGELRANGRYKPVTRLSEFTNIPEWNRFWGLAADVVMGEDMQVKGRPKIKGGKPALTVVQRTPQVKAIIDEVSKVIDAYDNMTGKEKNENRHIPLLTYAAARMAAIDVRLINPEAKDEPGSKVNVAIKNMMRLYAQTTEHKGTQVIFSDSYRPLKTTKLDLSAAEFEREVADEDAPETDDDEEIGFNLYHDIREKLIKLDVPASEIAIISEAKNDKQREAMFARVNSGEIRFILGSTETLGTGVNMQQRMIAAHHLDVPWTPAGLEQRDGRAYRQGNMWAELGDGEIEIMRYGMKDTLDAALWQKLETKERMIKQAVSGKVNARVIEDDAGLLNYMEQKAALSGADGMLKFELDEKVRQLKNDFRANRNRQFDLQRGITRANETIAHSVSELPSFREIAKNLAPMVGVDPAEVEWTFESEAPVKEDSKKANQDRLFSADYTGPRWTYGMRNRPLDIGTAPKGFIIGSDGPAVGRARHGTIQYPRELTKDEIYDFELEAMGSSGGKLKGEDARKALDAIFKERRKKAGSIMNPETAESIRVPIEATANGVRVVIEVAGVGEDIANAANPDLRWQIQWHPHFNTGKTGYGFLPSPHPGSVINQMPTRAENLAVVPESLERAKAQAEKDLVTLTDELAKPYTKYAEFGKALVDQAVLYKRMGMGYPESPDIYKAGIGDEWETTLDEAIKAAQPSEISLRSETPANFPGAGLAPRADVLMSSPSPYFTSNGTPEDVIDEQSSILARQIGEIDRVRDTQAAYQIDLDLFGDNKPKNVNLGNQLATMGSRTAARAAKVPGIPKSSADLIAGMKGDWAALAREVNSKGRASSIIHQLINREIPSWNVVGTKIETPADVHAVMIPLRSPYFESLKVMVVDGNNNVVASQIVSIGSVSETLAHPADIFGILAKLRESTDKKHTRIILSHNHPSGDPLPSSADVKLTSRIDQIAEMTGWAMLDHIITNGEKYYSFRESGLVNGPRVREKEFTPHKDTGKKPSPVTGEEAPWEVVRRSQLQTVDSPDEFARIARRMRQGDPNSGHLVILNAKLNLTAIERIEARDLQDNRKLTQAFIRARGLDGGYGIAVLLPDNYNARDKKPFIRAVQTIAEVLQMRLIDVIHTDQSQPGGQFISAREEGLMEDPTDYDPTPGGGKGRGAVLRSSPSPTTDGFYSQLASVVNSKIPAKATPAQIIGTLGEYVVTKVEKIDGKDKTTVLGKFPYTEREKAKSLANSVEKGRAGWNSPNGIKEEEIKWSGIEQALTGLAIDGKVPKDALLAYLADEGAVRFEEVSTKGPVKPQLYQGVRVEEKDDGEWWITTPVDDEGPFDSREDAERAMNDPNSGYWSTDVDMVDLERGTPRFSDRTLPGGENYREVVLAMPVTSQRDRNALLRRNFEKTLDTDEVAEYHGIAVSDYLEMPKDRQFTLWKEAFGDIVLEMDELYESPDRNDTYTSIHFPDVPNYVAHMRLDERTLPDGKRTMHAAEYQSDRHQAGRKKGYRGDTPPPKDISALQEELRLLRITGRQRELSQQEISRQAEIEAEMNADVPARLAEVNAVADAPFRSTWPLALFKRHLRDAVAGGFDSVSWDVGDTQGDRYDLSKKVSAIYTTRNADGTYAVSTVPLSETGKRVIETNANESRLADTIGKELADRVISSPDERSSFVGDQLKTESAGMKGFYDKMLVKEFGRYVSQWGGKVEKGLIKDSTSGLMRLFQTKEEAEKWASDPINTEDRDYSIWNQGGYFAVYDEYRKGLYTLGKDNPIWRIDITPEMRAGVERGQMLFSSPTPQESLITPAQDRAYLAAVKAGDMKTAQRMVDEAAKKAGYEIQGWHGSTADFTEFKIKHAAMFAAQKEKAAKYGDIVRRFYLKSEAPAKGVSFQRVQGMPYDFGGIATWAKQKGKDSASIRYKSKDGEIAIFSSSQIKSADPVTYDESGNVIPLSKRFNPASDSILYSSPTPSVLAIAPTPGDAPAIQQALAKLPPIYRKVFEDVSNGMDVAAVMQRNGVSAKAVENILNRVRNYLGVSMKAVTGLEPAMKNGKFDGGRPDLALSTIPAVAAVDQLRNKNGIPDVRGWEEVNAAAERMLAADYQVSFDTLLAKAMRQEQMSDTEVAAVKMIISRETLEGRIQTTQDRMRLALLINGYRDVGTETARSLAIRRDPHKTPAERHAQFIAEALFTPDPATRARMKKRPQDVESILKGWMKRVDAITADLLAQGIDLKAALEDFNQDKIDQKEAELDNQQTAEIITQEVKKLNRVERAVIEAMRTGARATKIELLTGVKLDRIEQIITSFHASIRAALVQAAQNYVATALRSAPSRDMIDNILADLGIYQFEEIDDSKPGYVDRRGEKKKERRKRKATGERRKTPAPTTPPLVPAVDKPSPGIDERTGTWDDRRSFQGQGELMRDPIDERTGSFDLNDPVSVKAVMDAFAIARGGKMDALMEFWRMSILTGPQTHVVNLGSNTLHAAYNLLPRRAVEATINTMLGVVGQGSDQRATFGEFSVLARNLKASVQNAARHALTSWQLEGRVVEAYATAQPIQLDFTGVGSEYIPPALGGKIGKVMRSLSFRAMTAADEFMKSMYSQMEAGAQAHRIAKAEKLTGAAYDSRVTDLMQPGSVAWLRAFDEAKRITFQEDINGNDPRLIHRLDQLAELAKKGRALPWLGHPLTFFLPFIDTPLNIFKQAVNLTPLGGFIALVDASRALKRRVFAGDMSKEEAKAAAEEIYDRARFVEDLTNQTIAWMLFYAIGSLVGGGDGEDDLPIITGTVPYKSTARGERDNAYAVMPPQTIRLGNVQFSYLRVDPFATALASLVDLHGSMYRNGGFNSAAASEWLSRFKDQVKDKTFLQGVSNLLNAIEDPDRFAERITQNIVTGFVPNLIRQPIREMNDTMRDQNPRADEGFLTSVAKSVGYSLAPGAAPAKMDVWGNEIKTNRGEITGMGAADAAMRIFNPTNVQVSPQMADIDRWIFRWNRQTLDSNERVAIEPIDDKIQGTVPGEKRPRTFPLTVEEQAAANRAAGQAARSMLGEGWDKLPLELEHAQRIKDVITMSQRFEREKLRQQKITEATSQPVGE